MIKCDFCVASWYDDRGVAHYSSDCNSKHCADAIRTMSEVMKEEYRNKNSTNVNKNYTYNRSKKKIK